MPSYESGTWFKPVSDSVFVVSEQAGDSASATVTGSKEALNANANAVKEAHPWFELVEEVSRTKHAIFIGQLRHLLGETWFDDDAPPADRATQKALDAARAEHKVSSEGLFQERLLQQRAVDAPREALGLPWAQHGGPYLGDGPEAPAEASPALVQRNSMINVIDGSRKGTAVYQVRPASDEDTVSPGVDGPEGSPPAAGPDGPSVTTSDGPAS